LRRPPPRPFSRGLTSFAATALAQPASQPAEPSVIERQVRDASAEWFQALASGDVGSLDRLEADDFHMVQYGPAQVALVDKARQLSALREAVKPATAPVRELEAVKLRTHGDTAILTAVATVRAGGPRRSGAVSKAMIVEVWVNQEGRWRIVHFQGTGGAGILPPAK
jgi:ketosteroid isomerase-like protein